MNDPQTWTLIAVFATLMLGGATLISRSIRIQVDSLDAKTEARFEALSSEIRGVETGVHARIDGVETSVHARIDGMETSVHARIDGVEAKMDGMETNLGGRLKLVEADLHLIKAHLLNVSAS